MENEIVTQWIGIGIGIEIFLFLEFHLIITVVKVPHCLFPPTKKPKNAANSNFRMLKLHNLQCSEA